MPYGLALRIKRICSKPKQFHAHCKKLTELLRRRGFKLGLIKEGIRKAAEINRDDLINTLHEQNDNKDRMIFATTYNPRIPQLKDKIHELHPILHSSEKCKNLFPNPPIIAYRRGRNLNDLLVSRRLPSDTITNATPAHIEVNKETNICEECGKSFKNGKGKMIHFTRCHSKKGSTTPPGFSKCGDIRCNTCKLGTIDNVIRVTERNKTFVIRTPITCKTSNLIYCLTCKKCQAQYIGETEQELHNMQSGHISDINTNKPGIPYVEHFRKCGVENYTITGVEKVRDNCAYTRKEREKLYKHLFDVQIK